MSAGWSTSEVLGRAADSLIDLLEADRVAVAVWGDGSEAARSVLVNLDAEQGERLLRLAREAVAAAPRSSGPWSFLSNTPDEDVRLEALMEGPPQIWSQEVPGTHAAGTRAITLAGVNNLLITRLPGRHGCQGVLVACNHAGEGGFSASDREIAELLAAQAGPLLETARLQEQRRYHAGVDERRRIAGELHDRLIQTLASMDLRSLACREMWQQQRWEALGEELRRLKRLAEEALEEARGAINELAPVRLREEGLAAYLDEHILRFQERVGVPVETSIELTTREVPESTALIILGLLREGLNNVRKHARAQSVTLEITQRGEHIDFRLTDDGIGFCPEQHPLQHHPTRHYGLAYLRERIAAVDGEMCITSGPEEGTVLEARVPLLTEARLVSLLSQAKPSR